MSEPETAQFLGETFRKGLIDRLDHESRDHILNTLQQFTAINVRACFRTSVLEFLKAGYGDAASLIATAPVAVGCLATLPDDSATRVRVVAVEDGFAWASPAHGRKDSPTFPVSLGALKDISAAAETGDQTPARLADEFIKQKHLTDGELSLHDYRNVYYRWRDGSYVETTDGDIRAEVMRFLRQKDPKLAVPKMQTAVEANLKSADVCHVPATVDLPCWIESGKFKSAIEIISFRNGNLDLEALRKEAEDDRIWLKPTPRLLTTTGRSYTFDQEATCPRWEALLDEVLPDRELQTLLQEMFGLCQIPDTSFQRFFVFFGPGANAKGVVSEVLAATVGQMNVASVSLSRFGERFSLWPLTTSLINLVAEIPSADHSQSLRIAEDKLKAIVSGDFIEVERKNKDIVKARPTARLVFSCNELPPIVDRSNGVWRRLIVIPFQTVIPPERQNPELAREIIRAELPGIFNWALEGLQRLQARRHFVEPKACQKLKAEHRRACAPEEDFLAEHVVAGTPADFLVIGDVYNAYRTYASGNGNCPLSKNRFVAALKKLFPAAMPGSRPPRTGEPKTRGYSGIAFHPNGAPQEEQA
jgi:putative DNA primase/helicase